MKNAVKSVGLLTTLAMLLLYAFIFAGAFTFGPSHNPPLNAGGVLIRSVLFSTVASLIAGTAAIPIGYFLSRWNSPGSKFIDAILEFPLVLSPVAMGTLILIFFSKGPGRWVESHVGEVLYTWKAIVLAQVMVVFSLALRVIKTAFDMVPARYEDMARTLGISGSRAFFTVTLPLARSGILSGFVLAWARAMGEFGASITVAGMHPSIRTIPIAIFERLESVDVGSALYYVLILSAFSILTLYLVRFLVQKRKIL